MMRVLVGCESSGIVRDAFRQRGHDAISCDLLPADDGSPHHIVADVRTVLDDGWEMGHLPSPVHIPVPGRGVGLHGDTPARIA